MGTFVMLFCRYVLGYNSDGGDYQTVAMTMSLDTLAVLFLLYWKKK